MRVRLMMLAMTVLFACVGASAHTHASALAAVTRKLQFVHTDALGSPVAESSTSGQLIAGTRTIYEPYGLPLTTPREGAPSYTGHQFDTGTGLSYMQARYYDPALGRFLSTDPMSVDTSSAFNFNRYAYAANSPYRFTDPDGRESVGEMIDSSAMAAAAAGDGAATYGWAFASVAWNYLGAEGVSQVADKGADASSMSKAEAVLNVATLGAGKLVAGGAKMVQGASKLMIKSFSGHAVDQAITRGVKTAQILDAIKNPLKVGAAKTDALGRTAQKITGAKATIVINPQTGKVITVYPTSTKTAEKLLKEQQS